MKRNWTVIRELLEHFEDDDISEYLSSQGKFTYISTESAEENERLRKIQLEQADITFGHLLLLMDSTLVEGIKYARQSVNGWTYGLENPRLTMKGHDTLDAIRSDTVWNEVKKRAKEAAVPITQELILTVLKSIAIAC